MATFLFPGTMIPKSGGEYAYIGEAFGPLPSFLFLWVALFILAPTANAITALTFAQNILQPLWPACEAPDSAVSLIAALLTCKCGHLKFGINKPNPIGHACLYVYAYSLLAF